MTVVKSSSKSKSKTSALLNRKKSLKSSESSDVFSDSHLHNSFEYNEAEAGEEEIEEEEGYSQAPK